VVARCHRTRDAAFFAQGPDFSPPLRLLAAALADVLLQALPPDAAVVRLCQWADAPGGAVAIDELPCADGREALEAGLLRCLPGTLLCPGAAALLVYSAVLTRGAATVREDAKWGASRGSLVVGPMHTCSMELVSLLCGGRADPDVLAYDPATQRRRSAWVRAKAPVEAAGPAPAWLLPHGSLGVGLLSQSEREAQQPVADDLKSPAFPVWLLHGGDHFTTLFSADPPLGDSLGDTPRYPLVEGSVVGAATAWHWNGLPPAGPRMALLSLAPPAKDGKDGKPAALAAAKPAPETIRTTYKKPKEGEVRTSGYTATTASVGVLPVYQSALWVQNVLACLFSACDLDPVRACAGRGRGSGAPRRQGSTAERRGGVALRGRPRGEGG